MATVEVSKISDQGMVVIPAEMLRHLGMETGSLVWIEERAGSILIRPAAAMETEAYTPERQAEFLLANAIDMDDYTRGGRSASHGPRPRVDHAPSPGLAHVDPGWAAELAGSERVGVVARLKSELTSGSVTAEAVARRENERTGILGWKTRRSRFQFTLNQDNPTSRRMKEAAASSLWDIDADTGCVYSTFEVRDSGEGLP